MNIKMRFSVALVVALMGILYTYLPTENENGHRDIIAILFVPGLALFLATLALTSLLNIQNESVKKKSLGITGIVMLSNIFIIWGHNESLGAKMGIAYVSTSVVAMIIRFFTLSPKKAVD